ncbi:TetR/AcrR family transcriptional regulator [Flavihumibacter sp. R14]|nr:TetR/AcrR family transcriptional regulator [Flavihumibacter soli]
MENQDKKRELIIGAALKRFAHFGLGKTTMNEIASDLSLSKPLLYYYFPDKTSLFAAVMDSIIKEIDKEMETALAKQTNSHKAILFYLDKRQEFVRKYFNLLEYVISTGPELPQNLLEIFRQARNSEIQKIQAIIKKGIDTGEFSVNDPTLTAEILLDALAGMRMNHFAPSRNFYPDKSQFEQILKKEKQLATIFLNGLK